MCWSAAKAKPQHFQKALSEPGESLFYFIFRKAEFRLSGVPVRRAGGYKVVP